MKKILDQSTLQARLWENLVLVSVEELQKAIAHITRHKVNTKEPSCAIPLATSAQPLVQIVDDASIMVGTQTSPMWVLEAQIGQTEVSILEIQTQGAGQISLIDQAKSEEKDIPKEKEQETIQLLVNLPTSSSPTKVLQRLSTDAIPLHISALGSNSSKVSKVFHYGDKNLDEEIVMPKYDYATMTLEKIGIM